MRVHADSEDMIDRVTDETAKDGPVVLQSSRRCYRAGISRDRKAH